MVFGSVSAVPAFSQTGFLSWMGDLISSTTIVSIGNLFGHMVKEMSAFGTSSLCVNAHGSGCRVTAVANRMEYAGVREDYQSGKGYLQRGCRDSRDCFRHSTPIG
jgi:hypothetical protein